MAYQPGVGLLDDILGIGQRAQQPVGEIDQLTPLAHDRVQARVGPAISWPGTGAHGAGDLPCSHYDDDQFVALVAVIALINAHNRMNVIIWQPAGDYQPGRFG